MTSFYASVPLDIRDLRIYASNIQCWDRCHVWYQSNLMTHYLIKGKRVTYASDTGIFKNARIKNCFK